MTNQTSIEDYKSVINENTAAILKVHRSNFFMDGFVDSPAAEEICSLAAESNVPYVEDIGSGAMIPTESIAAIEHAQTPAESLSTGADLVCFSGDKLLGGPQAGIIAGKSEYVEALKREPVARALRCDKIILAALQSTVDLYLEKSPQEFIPILSMLNLSEETLRKRAETITGLISSTKLKVDVSESVARIGGGALPRGELKSVTVDLKPKGIALEDFARRLRTGTPPVFGYTADGCYKIDLRTVFASQDKALAQAITTAVEAAVPGAVH
jgi:L-seryl-tRNA(Ser) seleniumtransferase